MLAVDPEGAKASHNHATLHKGESVSVMMDPILTRP